MDVDTTAWSLTSGAMLTDHNLFRRHRPVSDQRYDIVDVDTAAWSSTCGIMLTDHNFVPRLVSDQRRYVD